MNARDVIDVFRRPTPKFLDDADQAMWLDLEERAAKQTLVRLRAAAGGADRVVLCWDGDECTLRGLVPVGDKATSAGMPGKYGLLGVHGLDPTDCPAYYDGCNCGLFALTDVAVSSPEEDR